jgi:predicted RNase H-like nuclease (RuvC/YqgF family)
MIQEDYEVIPHKLLHDLRFDVEALQKKLTQPDVKINELILEIESMKDAIHDLNMVFERALEETKQEKPADQLQKVIERMDMVVSQNETIAQGMVAISDKVEQWMNSQQDTAQLNTSTRSTPVSQMPAMNSNRIVTPPMMSTAPMQYNDFPPPPPSMSSRKSLGGMFK